MSQATELAEAEARRAEAENPAEEPADPAEPEDPDNPATDPDDPGEGVDASAKPPTTDVSMEKLMARMDKESERHRLAVAKIMGDDFEAVGPCPLCADIPGFAFPPEVVAANPEQVAAVYVALGNPPEPDLERDPNTEICPVCKGWGELLTGAHIEQGRKRTCSRCGALGWVDKAPSAPDPGVVMFNAAPGISVAPVGGAVPPGAVSGYIDPTTGEFVTTSAHAG